MKSLPHANIALSSFIAIEWALYVCVRLIKNNHNQFDVMRLACVGHQRNQQISLAKPKTSLSGPNQQNRNELCAWMNAGHRDVWAWTDVGEMWSWRRPKLQINSIPIAHAPAKKQPVALTRFGHFEGIHLACMFSRCIQKNGGIAFESMHDVINQNWWLCQLKLCSGRFSKARLRCICQSIIPKIQKRIFVSCVKLVCCSIEASTLNRNKQKFRDRERERDRVR